MADEKTPQTPTPATAAPATEAPAKPAADAPRPDRGARPDRPRGGRGPRPPRREEPKEFDEEVLQIDRVSRMMKGGRRMSFRAVVVIGDRKGRVGFGMGKASEVQVAVQKAVRSAKKTMVKIPLRDGTVPHQVDLKHKAARIWFAPASEGTGVLAGSAIRPIVELGGIKNIRSKNRGTRNKIAVAQAMMKALATLRD